jgi:hypothetical protein
MKFSSLGFKYPDHIYSTQEQRSILIKPILMEEVKKRDMAKDQERAKSLGVIRRVREVKFGLNLGPNRPTLPKSKFKKQTPKQSSLLLCQSQGANKSLVDMKVVAPMILQMFAERLERAKKARDETSLKIIYGDANYGQTERHQFSKRER